MEPRFRLRQFGRLLAAVEISASAGAVIVEAIAGGVPTGAPAARRKERTIEHLRDHVTSCGYGRVGRRVAYGFRAAHVSSVVVDFGAEAIAMANERSDLLVEGNVAPGDAVAG